MNFSQSNRPVCLLWGGTGGHIFPLVALKNELRSRGFEHFYWLWEPDSLESRVAGTEGLRFYPIRSGKLRRYASLATLAVPFLLLFGFVRSLRIFATNRPLFVFSKGGYVSVPSAFAAACLGIPCYLHESDAVPGLANRIVSRFSKTVFLWFEEASSYFEGSHRKTVGQMLDPTVEWNTSGGSKNRDGIFVIGGSQGSSRIFSAVKSAAESMPETRFEIVLWKLNLSKRAEFADLKNVVCHDFLSQSQLSLAYSKCALAITRAWATALAEIEAAGVPMLIVPLEGSANDHQWANAKSYEKRGHRLLPEANLDKLAFVVSEFQDGHVPVTFHATGVSGVVDELISDLEKGN